MRISKQNLDSLNQIGRRGLALLSIAAMLATTFAVGARAQQKQKAQVNRLTEEQHILHVLNRLGFGARPGDTERVGEIGIQKYIEQQLNPGRLSDAVAEAKVKDLATLSMTTAQLYEKYPQPGQLLKQLQRRGDLPADLAAARQSRGIPDAKGSLQSPVQPNGGEAMTPEAMAKKTPRRLREREPK